MLSDSHLHLSFCSDRDAFLKSIPDKRIKMVFQSVDDISAQELASFTHKYGIAYFAGFHPLYLHKIHCDDKKSYIAEFLRDFIQSYSSCGSNCGHGGFKGLCGIGEIGLDKRAQTDLVTQSQIFYEQMKIAFLLNYPVSIHCIKCHDVMLSILKRLKDEGKLARICIHGAVLSQDLFNCYRAYDAYISFGRNILTTKDGSYSFSSSKRALHMLMNTPCNRMLFESDYDGKRSVYDFNFLSSVYRQAALKLSLDERELEKKAYENLMSFIKAI